MKRPIEQKMMIFKLMGALSLHPFDVLLFRQSTLTDYRIIRIPLLALVVGRRWALRGYSSSGLTGAGGMNSAASGFLGFFASDLGLAG